MSRSEGRQKRLLLLFAFLLVSQLVLMSYTARTISPEDGTEQVVLRTWVLTLVTPIQSAVGSVASGVASVWNGYVDLRGARERNADLERENGALRSEIETARAAAAENERLRRQLELKPLVRYDWVTANIVSRDATVWFKRVTIDKGTFAGIQLNQPVVTPGGLVGRVTAVGPNGAQVQLITDEHAGAGGRLTDSRMAGEIKGRGDGFLRLKSISSIQHVDEKKREGVVTSGLDGIYPMGILIGYVESVTPGAGASPQEIVIRPSAELDRIEEVMVLKVEPSDLATPETIKQ